TAPHHRSVSPGGSVEDASAMPAVATVPSRHDCARAVGTYEASTMTTTIPSARTARPTHCRSPFGVIFSLRSGSLRPVVRQRTAAGDPDHEPGLGAGRERDGDPTGGVVEELLLVEALDHPILIDRLRDGRSRLARQRAGQGYHHHH